MKATAIQHWFRKHWLKLCAGAAALAILGLLPAQSRAPAKPAGGVEQPTFKVQRGQMTISITQAGSIQAKEQEIILSQVEGITAITYLIEEGKRVKQGDLLVELDGSALQDSLVEQQIRTQNADSLFVRARETLAVTRNQAEGDIALAELNHRFAQEDLAQYAKGPYKQELLSAEAKITMAEEDKQLSGRKMEWSEKLFQENFISQSERDADRLSYNRAKVNLELAIAAKKLLENFTYTRQMAKLESDVAQTRRILERVKIKAASDIVQAEADLKAKEAEWHKQQDKEAKLKDQLAKTHIRAPRDGLVVYATSVRSSGWRGGQEPLDVGKTVRERQELIYLPTADEMIAVVQVHESNLEKVRVGLPVVVTIDALKGRSLVGQISRIAPLPDAASMWMNPDLKVYQTEIAIEGRHPDLRTGMSCMAEIIVDRYEDALFIPIQAVMRVDGTSTVYVARGNEFKAVPVEAGLDNNRMIRILSGLTAGQTVLLTPPMSEAATSNDRTPATGVIDQKRLKSMIKEAGKQAGNASVIEPAPAPAAPGRDGSGAAPERRKGGSERHGGGRPEGGAR